MHLRCSWQQFTCRYSVATECDQYERLSPSRKEINNRHQNKHLSSDVINLALRSVAEEMAVQVDADGSSLVFVCLRCSVPAPQLDAPRKAWLMMFIMVGGQGNDMSALLRLAVLS